MTIEIRKCDNCKENSSQHQDGLCDKCHKAEMDRKIQEILAAVQAASEKK